MPKKFQLNRFRIWAWDKKPNVHDKKSGLFSDIEKSDELGWHDFCNTGQGENMTEGGSMSLLVKRKNNNFPQMTNRMSMFDEFDRFFEDGFGPKSLFSWPSNTADESWMPRVNIKETDSSYKVSAELPGVEIKDIELTFQDNTLLIKGSKSMEKEESGENYSRVEMSFGSFSRVIPFTSSIDEEKVTADMKNGVLEIDLKKSEEVVKNTKKIKIKH